VGKFLGLVASGVFVSFLAAPVAAVATPAGRVASPAAIRTIFQARREAFKQKLTAIRDQRRRAIVSRADEKMNRINSRRTEHWEKVLARLTEILNRVEARAPATQDASAISQARAAIAAAETAVAAQKGKDYTLEIGSENALRAVVGQAISNEQAELRTVRETVEAARRAVAGAINSIKQ
jgi:hypothetical protein